MRIQCTHLPFSEPFSAPSPQISRSFVCSNFTMLSKILPLSLSLLRRLFYLVLCAFFFCSQIILFIETNTRCAHPSHHVVFPNALSTERIIPSLYYYHLTFVIQMHLLSFFPSFVRWLFRLFALLYFHFSIKTHKRIGNKNYEHSAYVHSRSIYLSHTHSLTSEYIYIFPYHS